MKNIPKRSPFQRLLQRAMKTARCILITKDDKPEANEHRQSCEISRLSSLSE